MDAFLHQLASGGQSGAIYASLALALATIYQSTGHVNFAQGEMATFSTFTALSLINLGFGYWPAFALTVAFSFALGFATERLLIRPLKKGSQLSTVVLFIGLLMFFHSATGAIWGHELQSFPSPFPDRLALWGYASWHTVGAAAIVVLTVCLFYLFMRFTSAGLIARAASLNPAASRYVGIRVETVFSLGWGFAAALGAVAGMMIAPIVYLDPNMMIGVLIYSFAGALLGGIDSPIGAAVGGLVVGVAESLAGAYLIGPDLKLTVALFVIVLVLTIRPRGLFGRAHAVRV